jgi:hypothetical protein
MEFDDTIEGLASADEFQAFMMLRSLMKVQPRMVNWGDHETMPAYKMAIAGLGMEMGVKLLSCFIFSQLDEGDEKLAEIVRVCEQRANLALGYSTTGESQVLKNTPIIAKLLEKEREEDDDGKVNVEVFVEQDSDGTYSIEYKGMTLIDGLKSFPSDETAHIVTRAFGFGVENGIAIRMVEEAEDEG